MDERYTLCDAQREQSRLNRIHDLERELTTLSEQRAELLSFIREVGFGFDCDSDAHKYGTTCRKCEACALLTKHTQPSSEESGT